MQVDQKLYLLRSARESNILPLTSRCNAACIFCSHYQNPPDLEVFSPGELELDEIEELAEFLHPERPVVIGESVTRVIEGEPLFHSRIREVLLFLRNKFPQTLLQITTNGVLLSPEMVEFLARIRPVRLYISLNSSNPDIRRKMMGLRGKDDVFSGIQELREAGIPFYGSILALPWVFGWDDLYGTVRDLERWGARMIRIFLPGYTRYARPELIFQQEDILQLKERVAGWQKEFNLPVVLEPPFLADLKAKVEGTLPGSPARRAGILPGDIICDIDGEAPFSRVDAFERIKRTEDPLLTILRQGVEKQVRIAKGRQRSSGLVVAFDISPARIEKIRRAIYGDRLERVLLLASPLGTEIIKKALVRYDSELRKRILLCTVASQYFGGSIGAAGLLVLSDYLSAWEDLKVANHGSEPEALLVPEESFDWWGRDLRGESYYNLEKASGLPVYLL